MLTPEKIIEIAKNKGKIVTNEITQKFGVSRQYASNLISKLVSEGKILKFGSTRKAFYVLPEFAAKHAEIFPTKISKTYNNMSLEEHKVLDEIEKKFPLLLQQKENVRDIFTYAFSEMLNNAIEHSKSEKIEVEVYIKDKILVFSVNDFGVGVFKNIMEKRNLKSETEAIQDLLKGKTTTMPKSHSGEGIFFTSKCGEEFILDSFGYQLIVNNKINDIFLQKPKKIKKGTKVVFKVSIDEKKHLTDIFRKYANIDDESDYGFDRTEIKIKLYTTTGIHISRSQARRVLVGLEKFKSIILDFDKVPMIGQGFADEIFRVFQNKYPNIKIQSINTNEAVKFMIDRVDREQFFKQINPPPMQLASLIAWGFSFFCIQNKFFLFTRPNFF
ncbi:MAG: DUF4325 domain-containing protein [Candidatus Paceibacterota bacterium]